MIDREKLKAYCEGFGVLLSPEQLVQFDGYCRLLLEWNKKMNLTAIREPEEVLIKHFVDSLALLGFAELPQGAKPGDVLQISGAGELSVDQEETQRRRKKMAGLQSKLFR